MSSDQKVHERKGLVAILDSLGSRDLTIAESKEFINNKNALIPGILKDYEKIKDIFKEFKIDLDKYCKAPEIMTFGDTIVLIWDYSSEGLSSERRHALDVDYTFAFGVLCCALFSNCIAKKFLPRGR